MSIKFLPVELIEAYQRQTINDHGGSRGLRDRNLLESAAARPENLEYYRPESSIGELAATLAWGLIKNHAFIDGNKRIGLICLVNFLKANGYRLISTGRRHRHGPARRGRRDHRRAMDRVGDAGCRTHRIGGRVGIVQDASLHPAIRQSV